jgi:hypothetical protein
MSISEGVSIQDDTRFKTAVDGQYLCHSSPSETMSKVSDFGQVKPTGKDIFRISRIDS